MGDRKVIPGCSIANGSLVSYYNKLIVTQSQITVQHAIWFWQKKVFEKKNIERLVYIDRPFSFLGGSTGIRIVTSANHSKECTFAAKVDGRGGWQKILSPYGYSLQ